MCRNSREFQFKSTVSSESSDNYEKKVWEVTALIRSAQVTVIRWRGRRQVLTISTHGEKVQEMQQRRGRVLKPVCVLD